MDGQLFPLLFVALVALAFWVLVLRPARARQQRQAAVVAALAPGTRVLLASGMVGEIVAVHEEDLEILIAPGVVATFVKQAVLREIDPPGTSPGSATSSRDTAPAVVTTPETPGAD